MHPFPYLTLLCALFLASCADNVPPRAIIPPDVKIEAITTQPVVEASKATREAVREIAKAGDETRTATQRLRAEIDRAEKLAAANLELVEAFKSIQKFADELQSALAFAEEKERIAIETIDEQERIIGELVANAAGQAQQIIQAEKTNTALRNQLTAFDETRDALITEKANHNTLKARQPKLYILLTTLAILLAASLYLNFKPL